MVASVQTLEDAASFAAHVQRLPIRGIDNDRGAAAHGEIGEACVDALPRVPAIGAAEYALCSGGCIDYRGVARVYRDCPCRHIQDVRPALSAILG